MPGPPAGQTGGSGRWAFPGVAYALGVVLAGANLPTPLYRVYQRADHFSTATLTAVFVAYVLAVAVSLAVAGQLSDQLGRRAVLLPAVLLAMASAASFALSGAVAWLVVGRVTSGLASGALTSVAPAALSELEPRGNTARASLVASAVVVTGLAAGPLVSGLVVQYAPWPTHLVYLLELLALLGALAGVAALPRDLGPALRPARMRWQRPGVPEALRPVFRRATLAFSAGWVGTAMFFALGPTFADRILRTSNVAAGAAVVVVVFVASAAAQLASRRWPAGPVVATGLVVFSAGMAVLPVALALRLPALLLAGGLAAGAGQGLAHRASQETVLRGCAPAARGQVVGAFYLAGYAAIAVVLVGLGELVDLTGPLVGLTGFVAVVVAAALASLALPARPAPPPPSPG